MKKKSIHSHTACELPNPAVKPRCNQQSGSVRPVAFGEDTVHAADRILHATRSATYTIPACYWNWSMRIVYHMFTYACASVHGNITLHINEPQIATGKKKTNCCTWGCFCSFLICPVQTDMFLASIHLFTCAPDWTVINSDIRSVTRSGIYCNSCLGIASVMWVASIQRFFFAPVHICCCHFQTVSIIASSISFDIVSWHCM